MTKSVFLYGPLCEPKLLTAITRQSAPKLLAARVLGFATVFAGRSVTLVATRGAQSTGYLWGNVPSGAFDRLVRFEGAYGKKDVAIESETDVGSLAATTFIDQTMGPSKSWDHSMLDAQTLQLMIQSAYEISETDVEMSTDTLHENLPMIEKRAWARVLAAKDVGPAKVRHQPAAKDVSIDNVSTRKGAFFRLQDTQISHQRFDGTNQGPLKREVFYGVDAALVLPYDPATDRVLLVEQLRMGPLMRSDPNPWSLEPVAGMVDAAETAEQTARRETWEEASLELSALELISANYPSPGASTDFFHCFLGICSLPKANSFLGGLQEENEDLRSHVMPFEQALNLVKTGEIRTGPLVGMIYWLALERDRLRGFS